MPDTTGESRRLSAYWADGPVHLVFLRRFGCGYLAYGLPDGVPATITQDFPWKPGDRDTAEQWTASRRGTERALVDHPWQLPGEFVIAQGGRIELTHRAQFCEDFPPTVVLLAAIASAQPSG